MPRVRAGATETVRHLRRPIRTREATATPPRSRPRSNAHAEADPARQLRRLHHTPPTRRAALRFLSRRSSTRLAGPQATAAQRMTVYFAEHDVTLHQGHVAAVLRAAGLRSRRADRAGSVAGVCGDAAGGVRGGSAGAAPGRGAVAQP